jgi:hypothetical protein
MVFKIYSEILVILYIKINSKLKINLFFLFFKFFKLIIDFLKFFIQVNSNQEKIFFLGNLDKII